MHDIIHLYQPDANDAYMNLGDNSFAQQALQSDESLNYAASLLDAAVTKWERASLSCAALTSTVCTSRTQVYNRVCTLNSICLHQSICATARCIKDATRNKDQNGLSTDDRSWYTDDPDAFKG
jgi:hypothetical protein